MKKHILKLIVGISFFLSIGTAFAQTDSLSKDADEISLEDLMNVKIVSASRKEESSFDAPLSTCAITRKDIDMMGATSIPEALKICPGLIVREMSNGTYDVAIRGLENAITHDITINNKLLLVMIDNRPVFNHLQGGTYWENLPINLIDVERIEVVNGPSSPLYGPNAVTGVINIITRKPTKDGLYATSNLQYGTTKTAIGQLAIGYKPNSKFDIIGSVNYDVRDRFDVSMYRYSDSKFISNPDTILSFNGPNTFNLGLNRATEKLGANLFMNYVFSEKVKIAVSGGYNNADAIKSLTTSTSISNYSNRSYNGMAKADFYNFGAQVSYLTGTQILSHASPQFRYNYNTLDAYLDYNLKVGENFSLRPAISYQNALIDDTPYTLDNNRTDGVFNNKATMTNVAGSLKADYTLKKKLRIIGAIRADKFKSPNDIYISYQGIVNYKFNENNVIRFIAAKSNSGSFIINSDVNLILQQGPLDINNKGSKDYKLVTNYMYELGYRVKVTKGFQVDLALFNQTMSNFSTGVTNEIGFSLATFRPFANSAILNLPQKIVQNGATLSLNIVALNNKLNIKPNVTYQESFIYNYSPYYFTASAAASAGTPQFSLDNQTTKVHTGSPKIFGGLFIGYQPIKKLNIGMNIYALDKSIMYGFATNSKAPGYTNDPLISNISGKFTASMKVSYKVIDRLSVFVNCRNLFNNDKVEFYSTDRIGALYMAGLNFEY